VLGKGKAKVSENFSSKFRQKIYHKKDKKNCKKVKLYHKTEANFEDGKIKREWTKSEVKGL